MSRTVRRVTRATCEGCFATCDRDFDEVVYNRPIDGGWSVLIVEPVGQTGSGPSLERDYCPTCTLEIAQDRAVAMTRKLNEPSKP